MSDSLPYHGLCSPWNSPGQNTRVPFPSPGFFPNLGIKARSTTLQTDSLPTEPQGKPKKTGVGGLSLLQFRNQTRVYCIAGGFFTNWVMREAHIR